MMAAPQPQNVDPAAYVLLSLLQAGFSVIPVGDDKRPSTLLPGRQWAEYQRRRATGDEWTRWWDQGARGWAIVCGQVSGWLYGCDCDEAAFVAWLEQHPEVAKLLHNTWVVRTCCGRIHIYLKSRMPVFSQTLKAGNLKVADIRGDGQGQAGPSYLVAPPSFGRCSHNPTGGYYTTIHGSPDKVMTVENALAVFQYLADAFARSTALQNLPNLNVSQVRPETQEAVTRPETPSSPDIPPPLGAEARAALEHRVRDSRLSRKIKRALLQGCVFGHGDWKDAPSNSDVDFALACALVRQDFSEQEIIDCFSTLHAGDFTFKNTARSQHGLRYLLDYTLPKARKAVQESNAAAQLAFGLNFTVIDHLYVPYDDVPTYYTTLRSNTGQEVKVKLKGADFESDRRFCRAVWEQSRPQFMPELQTNHLGAVGFRQFLSALGRMGRIDDDLPEGASESGYLTVVIRNMLRSSNARHASDDAQANHMAWIQDDWVIIRSEHLIARVKGVMGRIPTPQIWQAFAKLGGQYETVKVGGRMEPIWMVPVKAIGFEDDDQGS